MKIVRNHHYILHYFSCCEAPIIVGIHYYPAVFPQAYKYVKIFNITGIEKIKYMCYI